MKPTTKLILRDIGTAILLSCALLAPIYLIPKLLSLLPDGARIYFAVATAVLVVAVPMFFLTQFFRDSQRKK